ncbi:hypothetical protein EVAR_16542_1 [Eumeta japonica]|uniref:Uncharacterized protein n=1 Tax=Eumeta variegata TaxID=151549 RepID=A0A4C1U316_EUMVA|nr:hypothetical protein EVAR_16542_1 [Eumeta japonica]
MYSRELASARQVEPVNQALGTVIFSGVYHKGACPLPCKIDTGSRMSPTGCKLTHRIDSGSRRSPTGCKLTHRIDSGSKRSPIGCKLTHRIDSGSRRSPIGCKLTHKNRFWLEEEPHRIGYERADDLARDVALEKKTKVNYDRFHFYLRKNNDQNENLEKWQKRYTEARTDEVTKQLFA